MLWWNRLTLCIIDVLIAANLFLNQLFNSTMVARFFLTKTLLFNWFKNQEPQEFGSGDRADISSRENLIARVQILHFRYDCHDKYPMSLKWHNLVYCQKLQQRRLCSNQHFRTISLKSVMYLWATVYIEQLNKRRTYYLVCM